MENKRPTIEVQIPYKKYGVIFVKGLDSIQQAKSIIEKHRDIEEGFTSKASYSGVFTPTEKQLAFVAKLGGDITKTFANQSELNTYIEVLKVSEKADKAPIQVEQVKSVPWDIGLDL